LRRPKTVDGCERASLNIVKGRCGLATNGRISLGLTTLQIARDKSLQFPGFLVTLQAIDEIDLDLRVVKTGCDKPIEDLPAKRRSVDRPLATTPILAPSLVWTT
jgi:hypothetical protein